MLIFFSWYESKHNVLVRWLDTPITKWAVKVKAIEINEYFPHFSLLPLLLGIPFL